MTNTLKNKQTFCYLFDKNGHKLRLGQTVRFTPQHPDFPSLHMIEGTIYDLGDLAFPLNPTVLTSIGGFEVRAQDLEVLS